MLHFSHTGVCNKQVFEQWRNKFQLRNKTGLFHTYLKSPFPLIKFTPTTRYQSFSCLFTKSVKSYDHTIIDRRNAICNKRKYFATPETHLFSLLNKAGFHLALFYLGEGCTLFWTLPLYNNNKVVAAMTRSHVTSRYLIRRKSYDPASLSIGGLFILCKQMLPALKLFRIQY